MNSLYFSYYNNVKSNYFSAIIFCLFIFFTSFAGNVYPQIFLKVKSDLINIPQNANYSSHGAGWIDFNADGYIDILIINSGVSSSLYLNNKDGSFVGSGNSIISQLGNDLSGLTWGDFDNNGYNDLLFTHNEGPNVLISNLGSGSFRQITNSPLTASNDPHKHMHCTSVDYDNDGWLDVFIPTVGTYNFAKGGGSNNLLFQNNCDGTFTKIFDNAVTKAFGNFACANFSDIDNDGDMDLFATDWQQDNWLFENNGDGTFLKIDGTEINKNSYISSTSTWGDYDNDGYMDLFVGNGSGQKIVNQKNYLFHNNGDKTFTKITSGDAVNLDVSTFTSLWGDVDNDGDLDLFIGQFGAQNTLFLNDGAGNLTKVEGFDIVSESSSGAAFGDYDNDGFLDLIIANVDVTANAAGNALYHNKGNKNNWINVKCLGTISNKSAIGAKVKVKSTISGKAVWQTREINGNQGFRSFNDIRAHFGLGDAAVIDSLIIEWPSKIKTILTNVKVNELITIKEDVPDNFIKSGFSANIISGYSPLKVQFTDRSQYHEAAPVTSWSWDFDGDGIEDSNEKDPVFTFNTSEIRSYNVILSVSNGIKTDKYQRGNYVQVLPASLQNLAVGADVTASSFRGSYVVQRAVDGNLYTYWNSTSSDSQWLQLKLDTLYSVGRIVINWGANYASKYKIQFSSDGYVWDDLISVDSSDGLIDELFVNAVDAQYVKVIMSLSPSHSGYRIKELEIYKPGLTDIKQSEELVPSGFKLMQNYPNPFNPTTNFEFLISPASGGGFVKLKIYDFLGNEVATLVNEKKGPGIYTVQWNADGIASGVYFYMMYAKPESGKEFRVMKKMVLIK